MRVAEESLPGKPDRSRRVYVWWGVGFAFLALVGLFGLLVVRPVAEVRRAAEELQAAPMDGYFSERKGVESAVARLGGPELAARKIALYLRAPERLAGEYRWTAAVMLGRCGKPGLRELRRMLADTHSGRFQFGWWGAMAFDWYYRGSPLDWSCDDVLEAAAQDPDPETARLAREITGILNYGSTGPLPGPLMPPPGPIFDPHSR